METFMQKCNSHITKILIIFSISLILFTAKLMDLTRFNYHYLCLEHDIGFNDDIHNNNIPDIMEERMKLKSGNNIFFHETFCGWSPGKSLCLNYRQACAVESAARQNPEMTVYLMYAYPVAREHFSENGEVLIGELLNYANVKIRRVNLNRYIRCTPLEHWYNRDGFETMHLNEVLGYLTLWRFGGIYLDLDFVIMKSLKSLDINFVAKKSDYNVAAEVLSFDSYGYGHDLAETCLRYLDKRFQGDGVITYIMKEQCNGINIKEMSKANCKGYNVLESSSFYPISYHNRTFYFDPQRSDYVMSKLESSYGAYVWSELNDDIKMLEDNSEVPYVKIMKEFCPNVFRHAIV